MKNGIYVHEYIYIYTYIYIFYYYYNKKQPILLVFPTVKDEQTPPTNNTTSLRDGLGFGEAMAGQPTPPQKEGLLRRY